MARRGRALARYAPIPFLAAFVRFLVDPLASAAGKLFLAGTAVYVAMPNDMIPDRTPRLGWLDDAFFAALALLYSTGKMVEYRERSTFTG